MIKKSQLTILSIVTTMLLVFTFNSGCNKTDPAVTRALDSLDRTIAQTEDLLTLDFNTIMNRKSLILMHISMMKQYCTEEIPEELALMMIKYKGISKTYGRYVEKYPGVYNEHQELKKQAADLRTSITKREIERDAFSEYYKKEMDDAQSNLEEARKICGVIPSLEPDYQRISRRVQSELLNIAENNDELKAKLESLMQE